MGFRFFEGRIIDWVATFIAAFFGAMFYHYLKDRFWSYRYKWKCPVCISFVASSSSKAVLESVKAAHTHEVIGEDPSRT